MSILKIYLFLSDIGNVIYSRFGYYENNSLLRWKDNTLGLDTSPTEIDNYKVCLKSKFLKIIYKTSTNTASYNILDKLYSDLIVPIHPTDIYGVGIL